MAITKQLTLLLESKPGNLAKVCSDLATKEINILAISILDTIDSGLIRMVVSDHEQAKKVLEASGLNIVETDVLLVEMPDTPGVLANIARQFYKAHINIEYAYASIGQSKGKSLGVFWVSNLKKASEIMEAQE